MLLKVEDLGTADNKANDIMESFSSDCNKLSNLMNSFVRESENELRGMDFDEYRSQNSNLANEISGFATYISNVKQAMLDGNKVLEDYSNNKPSYLSKYSIDEIDDSKMEDLLAEYMRLIDENEDLEATISQCESTLSIIHLDGTIGALRSWESCKATIESCRAAIAQNRETMRLIMECYIFLSQLKPSDSSALGKIESAFIPTGGRV